MMEVRTNIKLQSNEKIIKQKGGLLNLAEELGNVSRVFEMVEEGGMAALLDRNRRKPNFKNRTDQMTEDAVCQHAVDFPRNDRVLPFFEQHQLPMLRILTDRGTEYCGKVEQHDYELYLSFNEIEHTKTKAGSPQTHGVCERFHKTILQELYQVTFRKRIYSEIKTLLKDLEEKICELDSTWQSLPQNRYLSDLLETTTTYYPHLIEREGLLSFLLRPFLSTQ